jgi:hypothetical protein
MKLPGHNDLLPLLAAVIHRTMLHRAPWLPWPMSAWVRAVLQRNHDRAWARWIGVTERGLGESHEAFIERCRQRFQENVGKACRS